MKLNSFVFDQRLPCAYLLIVFDHQFRLSEYTIISPAKSVLASACRALPLLRMYLIRGCIQRGLPVSLVISPLFILTINGAAALGMPATDRWHVN